MKLKKYLIPVFVLLVVSALNNVNAGTWTFTKIYIPLNDRSAVVKTKTTSTAKFAAGYRIAANELRTAKRIYTYAFEDSTSSSLAPVVNTLESAAGSTITLKSVNYYSGENSNSGLDVRIKYKDSNGGIGIGYYSDGKVNYY